MRILADLHGSLHDVCKSMWISMDSCRSLWLDFLENPADLCGSLCGSLWIPTDPCGSVCGSLWIPAGPYGSLQVPAGPFQTPADLHGSLRISTRGLTRDHWWFSCDSPRIPEDLCGSLRIPARIPEDPCSSPLTVVRNPVVVAVGVVLSVQHAVVVVVGVVCAEGERTATR